MKLEQTIDMKQVARLTLKNILSSRENKFKKKSYCKDFDKSILQITNNKTEKG